MEKPMFADVSHALHVSYLVLSLPPRQKMPFRNMLIQLLEAIDEPTAAQERWLVELRGPGGGGAYDPDRLTMDEYRAQYAMVTDAAKNRLPSQEYAVVLARYAHGPQKLAGCKRLALYARRSSGLTALDLLLKLVIRHYMTKKQRQDMDLTFRALAKKHKTEQTRVFRAARWMEANFTSLEALALDRLEPSFVAHGLISSRAACDSERSVVA